jgi:hypothetical protein
MALSRRNLLGLASGLSAPSQGGFWGGLSAGLGGALGGYQRFDQATHESEKEALRQMMEERRFALDQARYGLEQERVGMERERLNKPETSSLPEILRIPDAQWPTYTGRYRELHPESEKGPTAFDTFKQEAQFKADNPQLFPDTYGETETTVLERDKLGQPVRTSTRRISGKGGSKLSQKPEPLGTAYDPDTREPLDAGAQERIQLIGQMTDRDMLKTIYQSASTTAEKNAAFRRLLKTK